MEVPAFAAFTALWWISSFSILIPFVFLLKYNKSFRNHWFSWVYTIMLKPWLEPKFQPLRKRTFLLLKSHLKDRDTSIPLKVLEIGAGSGLNLQFYPENTHLTIVDKNSSFGPYLKQNMKKYPQVVYERTITCMAENMEQLEPSCMDLVVSTYCLCSVENVDSVLNEVHRVLKLDGKFLFLEHVTFPFEDWRLTVQRLVNPLWRIYFAGCHVNRNPIKQIQKKFNHVFCEKFYPPSLLLYLRPQILGVATKELLYANKTELMRIYP